MEKTIVNVNYWVYPDGTTSIIVSGLFPWKNVFSSPSEAILTVNEMLENVQTPLEIHYYCDGVGEIPESDDSETVH